tara:strand:+ start:1957 stop:2205 length:249 start_codon:yes stop_codon:yes gene_type:complete
MSVISYLQQEQLTKDAVILTGLSDAIMGYTDPGVLVYSYQKLVDCLIKDGMSREEAYDWIAYNILPLASKDDGFVMLYDLND